MELTNFEIRIIGEIQYLLYNDTPGNKCHMINLDNNNVITSPGILKLDNSSSNYIASGSIINYLNGYTTQIHNDTKLKKFFVFTAKMIYTCDYDCAGAKATMDTTGYEQIKFYEDKALIIMVNSSSHKIIICDHNFKVKFDKSAIHFVGIHADWLIVNTTTNEREYINLITFRRYHEMPLYRFKSNEIVLRYDYNRKSEICEFRKLKFSTDECVICMDDITSRVCLVPCGHTNICSKCVIDIKVCPNCRGKIQQKINLFV